MNNPISTQLHGVIDYLAGATWLSLPEMADWDNQALKRAVQGMGVGAFVYAACTDYELGLVPALSMKQHLAMDVIGGATMCALPFVTGEKCAATRATVIGFGLVAILAGLFTRTEPTRRRPMMLPGRTHRRQSRATEMAAMI
jgi:hypothetical protein